MDHCLFRDNKSENTMTSSPGRDFRDFEKEWMELGDCDLQSRVSSDFLSLKKRCLNVFKCHIYRNFKNKLIEFLKFLYIFLLTRNSPKDVKEPNPSPSRKRKIEEAEDSLILHRRYTLIKIIASCFIPICSM